MVIPPPGGRLLQQRNQRDNVLADLRPDKTPSEYEQRVLTEIALDETEFVQVRKRAILALAAVGVAEGELRELVNSPSQAVARLVIGHLDELLQEGTDLSEFLSFCVMTVNDSDDVGLVRRLIVKILVISLPEGLRALGGIDLTEIGARRRLAMVLGERESDIRLAGLQQEAVDLLARCLAKASEDGWIARGRALLERLSSSLGG